MGRVSSAVSRQSIDVLGGGIVKSTFDHHERNYQQLFRAITPTEHSRRGDNNTENACLSKIRAVE